MQRLHPINARRCKLENPQRERGSQSQQSSLAYSTASRMTTPHLSSFDGPNGPKIPRTSDRARFPAGIDFGAMSACTVGICLESPLCLVPAISAAGFVPLLVSAFLA